MFAKSDKVQIEPVLFLIATSKMAGGVLKIFKMSWNFQTIQDNVLSWRWPSKNTDITISWSQYHHIIPANLHHQVGTLSNFLPLVHRLYQFHPLLLSQLKHIIILSRLSTVNYSRFHSTDIYVQWNATVMFYFLIYLCLKRKVQFIICYASCLIKGACPKKYII